MVGAFIEFAIVVLLSQTHFTTRKNVRIATIPKKENDPDAQLRRRNLKALNVNEKEIPDIEPISEDVTNQTKKNFVFGIRPIHAVDFIAFFLFVFLYLLFNCIYWLHYLRE